MENSRLRAWILADEIGLGKTLATLSQVIHAYQQAKGKDLGQDLDDEVPKVDDHSEEKDDSGTTPDSTSLLSEDNTDAGAWSVTQAAIQERKLGETAALVKQVRSRRFKATLVLSPAQASNVWKNEIHRFFPDLKVKYWLGKPGRLPSIRERELTLGTSVPDLLHYLLSIPDSPKAMLHVIICTYSTWSYRTLYRTNVSETFELNDRISRIRLGAEDDDLD